MIWCRSTITPPYGLVCKDPRRPQKKNHAQCHTFDLTSLVCNLPCSRADMKKYHPTLPTERPCGMRGAIEAMS